MNKTYRLIWNHRLNAWVVASELTHAGGKKASGRTCAGVAAVVLALGTSLPLAAADLAPGALPTGGTVVAGQADIAASGTRMDITQGSQKAIINWQGFDIGSQAQVNFAQPNASAVALNRVSGPTATRIEGQLNANGQVFLINPNGVLFGNGARVNAGAFVASTLNIRDDDFLAGNYTFTGTGGAIENQGAITAAPGGYLAFIAPKITNAGTLSAPQGTVAMGAGERVTLNFAGDRLVGLSVAAETLDTLIENRQAIRAEGGAILLTAAGAEVVMRGVINNSGVLEAGSLTADGGRIVLTAGNDINLGAGSSVAVDGKKGGEIRLQAQSGTLLADGNISARGASGTGGSVQLLGRQVGLVNAAQVDASGANGGGTVLVGGDFQGKNPDVQNAQQVFVGSDASIKADATGNGNGGKVVEWADDTTQFYGTISAQGGLNGGNGGLVETSGHNLLDAQGWVNTLAPLGSAGIWLLDPTNMSITTSANANVTAATPFQPTAAGSVLTWATIDGALAGGNVIVRTAAGFNAGQPGNITIVDPYIYNRANALTFTAANNIVQNAGANIQNNGAGAVTLTASGTGTVALNANITTANGAVTVAAPGGLTQAATSTINTGTGTLTVNVGAASTMNGVIAGTGNLTKAGAGALTLSGANTYSGNTAVSAGTLVAANATALGAAGGTNTVANGAALNINNVSITGENVSIRGTGVSAAGVLTGSGSAVWGGSVAMAANSTVGTAAATDTLVLNGVVSGAYTLTKTGAGTLTLSGNNTYGSTLISAGTLQVGAGGTTGSLGTGAVTDNAALVFNRSNALTVTNGISGTGTLTQAGTGMTTLTANNTYAGTTTISAGTLQVGGGGTTGSLGTGAVTDNATLIFNRSNALTVASAISGTGTVIKTSAGILTLSGVNTYTGATNINGGTLTASGGDALPDASQVNLANNAGATLNLANSETIGNLSGGGATGGNVTLGATTLTVNEAGATTYSGVVSGTGGLTKTGAGTLTLGGINTYTGVTTINAGTLALNATGTIAQSSGVANNGALTIAAAKTIDSMTGAGTTALGANTLTIGDASNTSSTYTGVISGTGGLVKAGAGTLTLGGANTYSGSTTISAGTLVAANSSALGTTAGGTTVSSGATLELPGNIVYGAEALTLNGTGVGGNGALRSSGGNSTWAGTVTLASASKIQSDVGTLTLNAPNAVTGATRNLTVDGSGNTSILGTITTTSGGLIKNGTGFLNLDAVNTYTGTTTINAGTLRYLRSNAISSGAVVVNDGGTYNLNSFSDTIGALTVNSGMTGGTVTTGAGTLTLGGNVTSTGGAANATISGNLALGGNRTFTTTNAADGLTVSAVISGANTLTKAGAGTLTLSGANTYTGATTVSAGTLVAANASALGGTGSGTSVANGAALTVDNVALNAEPVTLQAGGTLRGNGNASLTGTVTQTGAATLSATAGSTLTLNGTVNAGAFATTISGLGSVAAANTGNNFSTVNIAGANNVSLRDANAITLGGGASTLTGNLVVQATGNITVANTVTTTGGDITLAGANFINTAGASALSASGRWLVYAGTVTGNTFGGLLSGNQAIWGTSYPAAVSQTGNRYVFANSPTLTVTSVNRSKTYGQDGAPIVAGAYTATGFINAATYGNVFTQDTQANTVTGNAISAGSPTTAIVGSYPIDVTPVTATTGYTLTKFNTGNLTVNPAPLTITGNTTTSQYTANAQTNGYTVSGLLTGNGDSVTGVSTLASRTNVGTTSDTLTSATGTGLGNYTISYVNGSLTITPATLTITGNTTTSQYTANAQTNGYTVSGLLTGNGDSITGVSTLASRTNVGTTNDTLTSATGTGLGNYTISYVNGSLTITPAPLTLNAVTGTKVYDGTVNSNGLVGITGLLGGDTVGGLSQSYQRKNVLGANGSTLQVNAGYVINDGNGGANYTVTQNTASGTITPAPLAITADDRTRPIDTPNPTFTATYAGLVAGETPADLSGLLQFSTPVTVASPAGDYPITPFGQSSANYWITYVDGQLQVVGQPVNPPIVPPVPPVVQGDRFDPQALAATYMDAVPMVGQVPAVLYVSDQDDPSSLPDAARIRVVGGGLNVSR